MKKVTIVLILIILSISVYSQIPIWTVGTAKTIPKNDVHLSMFYFSKYGVTETFEIGSKPLVLWKIPNIVAKKTWYHRKGEKSKKFFRSKSLIIGTVHGINYPTWLLRCIREKSYFDLIPSDAIIPSIFAFRNEVLISTLLKRRTSCSLPNYVLTLKLGTKFALKTGETNMPVFDRDLFARESFIYHNKLLWYVGLDLDASINYGLNYCVDVDFYSVGLKIDYWSLEHKGLIYWLMGKKKRIRPALGYKIAYLTYPESRFSIYPFFDITYMFTRNNSNQRDLFEDKLYDPADKRKKNYDYDDEDPIQEEVEDNGEEEPQIE